MYVGGNRSPRRKPTLSERVALSITWGVGLTGNNSHFTFSTVSTKFICHFGFPADVPLIISRGRYWQINSWNFMRYFIQNNSFTECIYTGTCFPILLIFLQHQKEFNVSAALNELYSYVIKYNDQLRQNLEEDEFARTYKLSYKLEQVHACMESEV
jgi:hypothetical protein